MEYKTSQREKLYDFLKSHPHDYFTVKQIMLELSNMNANISMSAIYRNLATLEKAGAIKKIVKKNSRDTNYRYIGCESCRDEIHITCSSCGKIFHMDHELSNFIQEQLLKQNNFILDKNKTVISGICKECKEKK